MSTTTADVIVVGSGAAGATAALRARADGNDVIVLEAGPQVGGTTRRSSGGFWAPNNSLMRARGIEDPRDYALKYMARLSYPELYDPEHPTLGVPQADYDMLAVTYDRTTEAVDFLKDNGHIAIIEMQGFTGEAGDFPPYYEQPDLDKAPYGRHLGAAYDEAGVAAAAGEALRGQGAQPTVGNQGDGRELSRQFEASMAREGIDVRVNHRVDGILKDDGEVTGVTATTPGGQETFNARKGVIFASGGFSMSEALSDDLLMGPIYGTGAAPECRGDFIQLTKDFDVELAHTEHAWWCEVPLELGLESRIQDWLVFIPWGDSMITVNREGHRVVNEKALYNDRGPAHFIGGKEEGYPNRILMMVFDEGVLQNPLDWVTRWPIPMPDGSSPSVSIPGVKETDLVISGDTLEEFAANVEARLATLADKTDGFDLAPGFVEGLKAEIERFNGFAASGVDEDFQRGSVRIQTEMYGPPRPGNDKNPTMFPFRDSGPYHCILLGAGTLETKGGPRIDPHARVVRKDGTPIPRLYGAGNCIANPTAGAYWSGGATLGTAMATGFIAGEQASAQEPVA
ncbi:unannotated protein [freshwater metagenome]|uniref:Unannotated protein n=1 Tax=freshwater metagenome TaxID=449393 RepID=A0A6J7IF85_9ZZZZ|nr:FAD-dependent oxidoreductase [Actinomycetota bacterium]